MCVGVEYENVRLQGVDNRFESEIKMSDVIVTEVIMLRGVFAGAPIEIICSKDITQVKLVIDRLKDFFETDDEATKKILEEMSRL